MTYNPKKHHRRSIRLPNYDYGGSGGYFLTICTYEKQHLFGDIANSELRLNEVGKIVVEEWHRSAEIRKEISLDAFVVMPNHIHGVVFIRKSDDANTNDVAAAGAQGLAPLRGPRQSSQIQRKPKSLSTFVSGFKSACTKRINELRNTPRQPVWQRNYYEHIIRNEDDLQNIRNYILYNPKNWLTDKENAPMEIA